MWLRRLVGVVLIITLVGMNVIAVMGLFVPDKKSSASLQAANQTITDKPTVSLTIDPGTVAAGDTAAITWSTTGNPTSCTASGGWQGIKTPFGAESTDRLNTLGTITYTLTCSGPTGAADATTSLTVAKSAGTGSKAASATSAPARTYCSGRTPCYGTIDVASHNSKGNCWGWLGDRVINVTGFDTGYHAVRSGVPSIELSGVCGKDLSAAVSGHVPTTAYPSGHAHTLGATSNTDQNYLSYFVGYYDGLKQ